MPASPGAPPPLGRQGTLTSQSRTLHAARRTGWVTKAQAATFDRGLDSEQSTDWVSRASAGLTDFLGAVKEELHVLRTDGVGRVAENLVFKTVSEVSVLTQKVGGAHHNERLAKCDHWGRTAAHIAASEGKISELEALYCLEPEIIDRADHHGLYPAHCAASSGHVETLKWFLGKDRELIFEASKDGITPAHRAASAGQAHVLEWLHGIDAKALRARKARNGCTPCHRAAVHGQVDVIVSLHRLDPDLLKERGTDGFTPVHADAAAGKLEVLRAITGIDKDLLSLRSASGQTPLDVARNEEAVELLIGGCSEEGAISASSTVTGSLPECASFSSFCSPDMKPMLARARSTGSAGKTQEDEECTPHLKRKQSPPRSPSAVQPERTDLALGAQEEGGASEFERPPSSEGRSSRGGQTPTADAQGAQAGRVGEAVQEPAASDAGRIRLIEMLSEEVCARKSAQMELGRMHMVNAKLRAVLSEKGPDGAALTDRSEAAELETGTILIQAQNSIRAEVEKKVEEVLQGVRAAAEKQAALRLREQVRETLQKERHVDPHMGDALGAVLDARLAQVLASLPGDWGGGHAAGSSFLSSIDGASVSSSPAQ